MKRNSPAPRAKFRRRADARPDEVLDAALDLFIEKGFAATRVEDIAAAAGISKGAVYLYFASKETILEGLVRRAIVPIIDNASTLAAAGAGAGDPEDVLKRIIGFVVMAMAEPRNAAIPRLIVSESANFPELARMYRTEVIDRGFEAMTGVVRRGIECGRFRPVDPGLAIRNIVGPIFINVLMTGVFGFDAPDPAAFARSHVDILLHGLGANREGA
jgi:AcrR family transcriptional regulator